MKNLLRFLCILALTTVAFLIGTSWRINHPPATEKQAEKVTTFTEEKVAPIRNNLPENGLNSAELATISLFEKATPSVVFITTSDVYRDWYTQSYREQKSGSGSGFIWDNEGHIITNYHVIKGASKATVTLSDQSTYSAKLVGKAPFKDLAVLKIDAPSTKLKALKKGTSDDLRVGQSVLAIGTPFGLDQTLTTGIVSALGREISSEGVPIRDVIQTDAAINPGNSGGPLLNSSGELIGVNTAIYSPSGASAGIGFSIPVDAVKWVVKDLIRYGEIKRPTLGLEFIPRRTTYRLGIKGLMVSQVEKNSVADKVGIRPLYRDRSDKLHWGDIIMAIDGEPIQSQRDYLIALESRRVGEEVEVLLKRDEEQFLVSMTLEALN
ncbi:MAG: trypsin-like peptidase domain-containing protein [Bacteroidota bacterium]